MMNQNETGFTILELLVSLLIIGMIVLMLGSLLKIGLRGYQGGSRFTEMQENCRTGVEMMTGDIRKCREIVSASGNTLVLKSQEGDEIRYYTNSNVLYRAIKGTPNPTVTGISDFRAEEAFPDEIGITLKAVDGRNSYELVTRAAKGW